jgi:predicted Zn-dependent protease
MRVRALLLLVLMAGCSASMDSSRGWVAQQGGIVIDARQQRAMVVLAKLTDGQPEWHVSVQVLNSEAVCAFAWPNRTIYVTRGLMDRADDNILAAALAHERMQCKPRYRMPR